MHHPSVMKLLLIVALVCSLLLRIDDSNSAVSAVHSVSATSSSVALDQVDDSDVNSIHDDESSESAEPNSVQVGSARSRPSELDWAHQTRLRRSAFHSRLSPLAARLRDAFDDSKTAPENVSADIIEQLNYNNNNRPDSSSIPLRLPLPLALPLRLPVPVPVRMSAQALRQSVDKMILASASVNSIDNDNDQTSETYNDESQAQIDSLIMSHSPSTSQSVRQLQTIAAPISSQSSQSQSSMPQRRPIRPTHSHRLARSSIVPYKIPLPASASVRPIRHPKQPNQFHHQKHPNQQATNEENESNVDPSMIESSNSKQEDQAPESQVEDAESLTTVPQTVSVDPTLSLRPRPTHPSTITTAAFDPHAPSGRIDHDLVLKHQLSMMIDELRATVKERIPSTPVWIQPLRHQLQHADETELEAEQRIELEKLVDWNSAQIKKSPRKRAGIEYRRMVQQRAKRILKLMNEISDKRRQAEQSKQHHDENN